MYLGEIPAASNCVAIVFACGVEVNFSCERHNVSDNSFFSATVASGDDFLRAVAKRRRCAAHERDELRRFMGFLRLVSVPWAGGPVLGVNLNCSESRPGVAAPAYSAGPDDSIWPGLGDGD